MYPAPPARKMEIFARIPDRFRKPGQISHERMAAGKGSPKTDCFIEGPAFDRSGNLFVVDVAFGRVFRISPEGVVDLVTEYDGEPNGLKIDQAGRILIADHKLGLLELNAQTGAVTPVVGRYQTEAFKGLNDLFIGRGGQIYFTDQGQSALQDPSGRVYRLDPDGRLVRLLDGVPSPNGLVLNASERHLYLAVTRANSVWRGAILPDGSFGRAGVFIQLSGGIGPDGMAMDAAGNLLVAHAGAGIVWVFSPTGVPVLRLDAPQTLMTTNVAFGGDGNRRLFVTESDSGCVLTAELDVPGQPLHSHQ